MSDSADPGLWLRFARENADAARMLMVNGLLNSCLQNAQQAVEKSLKSVLLNLNLPLQRTHHIRELAKDLQKDGVHVELSDDDCELIDSVYLPSKYPPEIALPDAAPDKSVCQRCVEIAERAVEWAVEQIAKA